MQEFRLFIGDVIGLCRERIVVFRTGLRNIMYIFVALINLDSGGGGPWSPLVIHTLIVVPILQ
jgi:hypothetical protein